MGIERLREPCPKWAAIEIDRLRAELAAAQTIATRERAEADVQIERRIEVEAELAAKDARIAELEAAGNRLGDAAVEGALTSIEAVTELAETKARIAKLKDDVAHLCGQMAGKIGEGVAKNARIAELEAVNRGLDAGAKSHLNVIANLRTRAERAEAELKAVREALKYLLSELPDQLDDMRSAVLARAALAPPPAGPDGKSLAVIYCMERAEEDVKLLREALEGMIAVAEGRFDGNPHADIDALAKARAVALHLDRRPRQ